MSKSETAPIIKRSAGSNQAALEKGRGPAWATVLHTPRGGKAREERVTVTMKNPPTRGRSGITGVNTMLQTSHRGKHRPRGAERDTDCSRTK